MAMIYRDLLWDVSRVKVWNTFGYGPVCTSGLPGGSATCPSQYEDAAGMASRVRGN